MKKIIYSLIAVFALSCISVPAYADRHNHDNRAPWESSRGNSKRAPWDKDKKNNKKHKTSKARWDNGGRYHKPAPPPRKHGKHSYNQCYNYRNHPRLHRMVNRCTRGGRDVMVWQLTPQTYIVRYYYNGRYLMREINTALNTISSAQNIVMNNGSWYVPGYPNRYYQPSGPSININIGL